MERFVLTGAQWAKMEPHCLGMPTDPGRSGRDNRRFIEAVLWIARMGSPWRDLPNVLGNRNTAFKRYHDRIKADVFFRSSISAQQSSIQDESQQAAGQDFSLLPRKEPPIRHLTGEFDPESTRITPERAETSQAYINVEHS